MQSFFIWKNVDSRSMGITLESPVPIIWPPERVGHVGIPGRSGDLTDLEGEAVYNSYIQTATIQIRGGYRSRDVKKWLTGSGYVTFSGEPDRRQMARVINAVTLTRHSRNLDIWVGDVQFYCQPLKESLSSVPVTISASGSAVENRGDVPTRPKITINAAAAGSTLVVSDGTNSLTVDMTGMADTGCVVDCEAQIVTNYDGFANLTALSSGNFPVLSTGENTITGSGWSSLEIERRERYL